jgi:hypothetical protein
VRQKVINGLLVKLQQVIREKRLQYCAYVSSHSDEPNSIDTAFIRILFEKDAEMLRLVGDILGELEIRRHCVQCFQYCYGARKCNSEHSCSKAKFPKDPLLYMLESVEKHKQNGGSKHDSPR